MGPIKKFLSTDLLVLYVVITSLFLNIPVFFFCVLSRGLIACPYSFEIHTIKRNFKKKRLDLMPFVQGQVVSNISTDIWEMGSSKTGKVLLIFLY